MNVWKQLPRSYRMSDGAHECDVWRFRVGPDRSIAKFSILNTHTGCYVSSGESADIENAMTACEAWLKGK